MDHNLDGSILLTFLEAKGKAVSGDTLAGELGVSRVAIWSRLNRLRQEGFVFEAAPRKGYRLKSTPAVVHPALLEAYLRQQGCQFPCEVLDTTDSTNSKAERRLARGDDVPFALLARRQTAGRGRLGRQWQSDNQGNLYLSLAFRPFLPLNQLGPFTVWMGLAVCDFLETTYDLRLRLKWPNDLLDAKGRKLAGMLTEARVDADSVRDLVFGLGLNLAGPNKKWTAALRRNAGSLQALTTTPLDINQVAAQLIVTLEKAWEQFSEKKFLPSFRKLALRYDGLKGTAVRITLREKPLSGVAEGIEDDGSLKLRQSSGKIIRVTAGEVTLRKPRG